MRHHIARAVRRNYWSRAAVSSSAPLCRAHVTDLGDPRPPDLASILTPTSQARQPSPIRALMPLLDTPGMISLGGGLPHPDTFPFGRMSVRLADGTKMRIDEGEMQAALQYSPTAGLPGLVAQLKAIVAREHAPPFGEWDLCVTSGSQDALTRAFEMLVPPGGNILVESPTYSGSLAFLGPYGCGKVAVQTDEMGLVPESLEEVLAAWDESRDGPRPRVLYTIPNGSNPTGGSLTMARKRRVYEIARRPENDLIVLEDDPYYYLQFGDGPGAALPGESAAGAREGGRVPSLLSLDVDGRVLRFDSFSKLLSAGCRLGWATASPLLIERMTMHIQATTLHTSGVSQILVQKLLERWEDHNKAGYAAVEPSRGFERHVQKVTAFYRARRDHFLECAERHLAGAAEWTTPSAGMFSWIKLLGVEDSMELIQSRAVDAKVLFVPGGVFMPNAEPSPCVRASYSTASKEDVDEAMARLSRLLSAGRSQ
eukprot:g6379.t1